MKPLAIFVVIAAVGTLSTSASAQNQASESPSILVQMDCQICHSGVLIQQQRLSRDVWLSEVKKMKAWGSPISNDQLAIVADYLASKYGPNVPAMKAQEISARAAQDEIAPEPDYLKLPNPKHGNQLYEDACASCHNSDAHGKIGPDLVQQPILFRRKDWDYIMLHGRRSMPSFNGVLSRSDIADILAWVRTQKVTFGD